MFRELQVKAEIYFRFIFHVHNMNYKFAMLRKKVKVDNFVSATVQRHVVFEFSMYIVQQFQIIDSSITNEGGGGSNVIWAANFVSRNFLSIFKKKFNFVEPFVVFYQKSTTKSLEIKKN